MSIEEVCNIFFYDNKSLASPVLLSYQQAQHSNNNKHAANTTTFINYLLNSKEFNKHYQSEFKKVFRAIFTKVGRVKSDDPATDDLSNNAQYLAVQKDYLSTIVKSKSGVKREHMQQFLKEEPLFEEHYHGVVNTLYTFFFSDTITQTKMDQCMQYIRTLDFLGSHSIDNRLRTFVYRMRENDDESNKETTEKFALDDHKQHFVNLYQKKFNQPPSLEVLDSFITFFQNKENVVNVFFESKYNNCSVFYANIVSIFQKVFRRDITVFEYVKYYSAFSDDHEQRIKQYHTLYNQKFQIVNNIYDQYISSKIDDTAFIHRFLDIIHMDDKSFHTRIIETVVNYDEYTTVMCNLVDQIYYNTFDKKISELDRKYFFNKVYQKKHSLVDDHLPKLITTLKDETDSFEQTIERVFDTILQRTPERVEIDHYIDYFRSPKDNIQPNIKLEDELYESLEYHDIIKASLTDKYSTNKSELYKMLRHVLGLPDPLIKRDHQKIHQEIDAHFF